MFHRGENEIIARVGNFSGGRGDSHIHPKDQPDVLVHSSSGTKPIACESVAIIYVTNIRRTKRVFKFILRWSFSSKNFLTSRKSSEPQVDRDGIAENEDRQRHDASRKNPFRRSHFGRNGNSTCTPYEYINVHDAAIFSAAESLSLTLRSADTYTQARQYV